MSIKFFIIRMIGISILSLLIVGCVSTKEERAQKEQAQIKAANYNVQLGMAYLKQDDIERAKFKLNRAMEQAPNAPDVNNAMAYFLEKTNEPQRAERFYRRAISLAPRRGASHSNYGTFLCRAKRYDEAEKQFLLAVADPQYLAPAEAYENAGLCFLMDSKKEKARFYFQKALAQDPTRLMSLYELSKMDYQDGQYQSAEKQLDQYLRFAKPNVDVLTLAERAARKQGKTKKARQYKTMLKDIETKVEKSNK